MLWEGVKNKKLCFRIIRQAPIYVFTEDSWRDRYIIADFYCPEKKLVIEIDWNIHDEEEIYNLDRAKEELLVLAWYNILRFTNWEVIQNINSILKKIQEYEL